MLSAHAEKIVREVYVVPSNARLSRTAPKDIIVMTVSVDSEGLDLLHSLQVPVDGSWVRFVPLMTWTRVHFPSFH
jgi:hypothetical protein